MQIACLKASKAFNHSDPLLEAMHSQSVSCSVGITSSCSKIQPACLKTCTAVQHCLSSQPKTVKVAPLLVCE